MSPMDNKYHLSNDSTHNTEDLVFSGNRLSIARRARGFTMTALATEIGLTASSITQFENEKKKPSSETVIKIQNILNFPSGYF